jgi:hypothetical protein
MAMTPELLAAIQALINSILEDEHRSGGLLSRKTLRLASVLAEATRQALAQVIEPPPQTTH